MATVTTARGIDLQNDTTSVCIITGDARSQDYSIDSSARSGTCVLPPTRQHRIRGSTSAVATSWNNGLPGSAERQFAGNCARVPAAALWQLLRTNQMLPLWHYRDLDDHPRGIGARDILRAMVPAVAPATGGMDVLALPNALTEWAQEHVLAAWPSAPGVEKRLLWRPVAAAMAWSDTLDEKAKKSYHGKRIAVVDVEPWTISETLLELHHETAGGRSYLVPERFVPDASYYREQPLPPIDIVYAEALLTYAGITPTPDLLWYLVTGCNPGATTAVLPGDSGWASIDLAAADRGQVHTDAMTSAKYSVWREVAAAINGAAACQLPLAGTGSVAKNIGGFLKETFADIDAVLLTGPCLAMPVRAGTLADVIVQDAEISVPLIAEGLDGCPSALTRTGCALFGLRAQLDLPTYYDHLQQLEILVQRQEDIVPEVLVQGGRIRGTETYSRSPIAGFYLDRNFEYVEFYLRQEGSEQLKVLHQDFRVRIDRRQPITLQPSVCAGQGHARVEVHNDALFGHQPVLLDWLKMADSDRTLPALADEINRSYPPYIPDVKASAERWEFFLPHVKAYLEYPLLVDGEEQDLGVILTRPMFWSVARVTYDEADDTGLGRYNVFGAGDEHSLPCDDPLVQQLLERLSADFAIAQRPDNRLKLIRCIAWTYQGTHFIDVRRYLVRKLQQDPESLKLQELTGCAQLFRDPEEFQLFFSAILESFDRRGLRHMTDYLRNLRKLMTYRPNLFEHVDSDTCLQTAVWAARMLEAENLKQNFQNTSLLAILSILFLLRRRRFDRDFLYFDADQWEPYQEQANCRDVILPPDEPYLQLSARRDQLVYDIAILVSRTETLLESKIENAGDEERCEPDRLRLAMVREIAKFIQGRGRFGGIPLKELG